MSAAETSSICLSVMCIYVMSAPPQPSPPPSGAAPSPPRPTRVAYANAADAHLEILPNGETQTKPIGSSILLTCKPKVDDPSLVQDMQWIDPHNEVIESLNMYGHTKPAMYTELHQDGSLSLFVNSLQEEQEGKYTCKGSYARTEALNKSVTIETIVAITWDNAPVNQYPILGEDYSIQCQVRARPSPSVDWLYNGELIKTNNHYVIETYSLKIKNVQESDDGIYTCRASVQTTGELQERPIRVEVHTRPSIEEISNPVDIIEGENANIECKGSGKPLPTYSWVKLLTQQNLSNADRFGVDPVTGVLTITNVNREDAGEYQCTATNAAGNVVATIQVNVIVKPKIMEFYNRTVVEKKSVDLSCKVFGQPPPEVTFRKFTAEKSYMMGAQPDDDRIIVRNGPGDVLGVTIGNLTILDALTSNDGLYECIAKNTGGVAYMNGHLTVEFPPSFRSMPNVTVWSWEQRPVNLTCIAESIPNATIRWSVHGDDRRIENDPLFKQFGNGPISTLNVVPLDQRYYTFYRCIAANPHGTREHLIELKEARKPQELLNVRMIELTATSIRFDLVPPAPLDLPVKTITVQYKEDHEVWAQARNKTWSIGSLYVIEGLKPQTPYEFRFAAKNDVGLGNWGANHREITPGRTVPNQPKFVKPQIHDEYDVSPYHNQYELAWLIPPDNGEPIDFYQIKYCLMRHVVGDWEVLENSCRATEVKSQSRTRHWLRDLYSDTFYRIELQAHNIMGYSNSGFFRFKTARGPDPSVVQHQGPLVSSAAIIGIVIAILVVIIIIIDVICCCAHKTGMIYFMCERSRRKPVDEEDAKLGRDEKEPLKEEKKITPIIDSGLRRETSITFDGKRSISKTGFVGKDSAV